jgi:hypothetical protein
LVPLVGLFLLIVCIQQQALRPEVSMGYTIAVQLLLRVHKLSEIIAGHYLPKPVFEIQKIEGSRIFIHLKHSIVDVVLVVSIGANEPPVP